MEGGHRGKNMRRIKALQAKNAQAAGNTGNTAQVGKSAWNTSSMTDAEISTRNPKGKHALQQQAKLPKSATTGKTGEKTYKGDVSYSDVKKNKKGADYRASHGVGDETALGLKPPSAFAAAKTATKKKRKKNTKRAARKRFREAVVKKNKKPKTKKTKKQKELEAAYGSPKDTERMMKGKNLKEGLISKLSKKFKKGK